MTNAEKLAREFWKRSAVHEGKDGWPSFDSLGDSLKEQLEQRAHEALAAMRNDWGLELINPNQYGSRPTKALLRTEPIGRACEDPTLLKVLGALGVRLTVLSGGAVLLCPCESIAIEPERLLSESVPSICLKIIEAACEVSRWEPGAGE